MIPTRVFFQRHVMPCACWYRTRLVTPSVLHRKRSHYFSSMLDDQEEDSIMSTILVHERYKHFNSYATSTNTSYGNSGKMEQVVLQPETKLYPEFRNEADVQRRPRFSFEEKVLNGQSQKNLDNPSDINKLMKPMKSMTKCYVISQNAADVFINHLKRDLKEGDIIAEADPGLGVLTRTLLHQTNCKVIAYEPNATFAVQLRSELTEHADRLEVHCVDLLKFYEYFIVSMKDETFHEMSDKSMQILKPLPSRNEQDVSPVKIFASLTSSRCIQKLVHSFTFQCSFYQDIYPDIYFYIPDTVYRQLTSSSAQYNSRRVRIPFLFYFDVEHLDVVPINLFYSRNKYWSGKLKQKNMATRNMHLIKISPKRNVHEVVPRSDLSAFHFFTHSLNRAKPNELFIFCLEKFIPGCGIEFIKNGFSVFDHPRQVPPERLLAAFNLFKSLPSYKESMFHHACSNWMVRYGQGDTTAAPLEGEDAMLEESLSDSGEDLSDDSAIEITDEEEL